MLPNLSLRRCALAAPANIKTRDVSGGPAKTVGAKQISGARKQELGNPVLCNAAAAAASSSSSSSSSSSPRRRPSSSFAFGEDDLDDDLDAPPLPRSPSDYALLLSEAEQRGDWVKAVELVAEARVLRVRLPAAGYEAAARAAAAADQGDWQKAASFLARAARGGGGGGGGGDEAGGDDLPPPPPACSAIKEVFSRLAREVQAEAIMDLLDLLRGYGDEGKEESAGNGDGAASSSSSPSPSPSSSSSSSSSSWSRRPAETRSHALNCAARACARASSGGKKMMRATDSNSSSSSEVPGQEEEESLSEEDRRIFFEASLSLLDDMREGDLKIEDGTFGSVALAALAMGEPELSEELLEERDYL